MNSDELFLSIERKYDELGRDRGTSYEVELMRALESRLPEMYGRYIPGFLANLTCEMDLPTDEIDAARKLETQNPEKYDQLCGFLANLISDLDNQQLELLV